ncbi:hypothetical protein OG413_39270 [Streptomyces sp. NBC_01433]|uniref:hypothetical protein n=1 Tax=Streptomyces sp. NBC_01433 TaxID=2903864 RepID=UPI00225952EF|nr:hypothetical protein [Streptomyces sp. NBC_01433]MCX4681245.1 hypothetical protein [Streptomyces sp. NBC_01433]
MKRPWWRRPIILLVCVGAMVAAGLGGWTLWTDWQDERVVDEACASLVPPEKLGELPLSGGRISSNGESINVDKISGTCMLASTEAGEVRGQSHRAFFSAGVSTASRSAQADVDDSLDTLIDDQRRYNYPDSPVGGGIAGLISDSGVQVRLSCPDVRAGNGEPVGTLVASAVQYVDGYVPLFSGRQMDQRTRDNLASIAVDVANALAAKLGCAERLPDPPGRLPGTNGKLKEAAAARGSCSWYGRAYREDAAWLPDEVLETRADPLAWQEKCGLAVRSEKALELYRSLDKKPDHRAALRENYPDKRAEWWASTQSFFGEFPDGVGLPIGGGDSTRAAPGTAGRVEEGTAWWATSVCDGKPAVHTLTLGYGYGKVAAHLMEPVFRAYVKDVAERRGCMKLKFPRSADFTAR